MTNQGLLDALAACVGCAYLSDLRYSPYRERACRCLCAFEPGRYPVAQWNSAIAYLLGCAVHFESAHEARAYLRGRESET